MKFIHMADMHFDAPFSMLHQNGIGDKRRLEQRKIFKSIIEYIKENNIPYLLIAGDLYEQEYIRESTIKYINDLFDSIPDTKIYITPGNHDPYLKNSYYNKFNFSPNVKIFTSEIEKIENEEFDIYGYGFSDFFMSESKFKDIKIDNPNKINILLTHSSIDGIGEEASYNPIKKKNLKDSKFDYIALGHIHKPSYKDEEKQKIIYPGSTIAHGFDEQGKHGVCVVELEKNKINLEFLPLDEKEFVVKEFSVDEIDSKESLIENLNELSLEKDKYYEINLIGKRNFEINTYEIQRQIEIDNILKIKNQTKIRLDLEQISKENSLRGIFVKKMLEKINDNNREKIEKAIEIGLESM